MSDQGRPPSGQRQGRPPAGRSPSQGGGGGGGASDLLGEPQTAIGIGLIVLAVVIGLFLLARGFADGGDSGDEASGPATSIADIDRNAPPTLDPSASTTAPTAVRPAAEVTVLVANAAGVAGAAGAVADSLEANGYTIVDTANAPSTSSDQVLYSGDLQAEAEALAESLGLDASAVSAMPDPPPLDLLGADVLVMVGPNLASAELPSPTTESAGSESTTTTTTSP